MGIQRQEQWLARTSVLWKESENSDGQLGQCPKARSWVRDLQLFIVMLLIRNLTPINPTIFRKQLVQ